MKKLLSIIALVGITMFNGYAQNVAADSVSVAGTNVVQAQVAPYIDFGNTAWVLVATALVLFMTIPGLALFYGGLVRRKNILSIFMQCFLIMALITVEWIAFGYSVTFSPSKGFLSPIIGNLDWAFLRGIRAGDVCPFFISQSTARIPHYVYVMYQCMFAVITPALIIGAFAERMRFKGFIIFIFLWSVLVYNPVAHWIWSSDGWLYKMGAIDFAGGIVVHTIAGIAAIVVAIMLGKRKDYRNHAIPAHNIPFVAIGTAMLWFGWFGFNAGSSLAADGLAANAFVNTQISASMAALVWAVLDWYLGGKPTTIGICTGAIAGLATITPAAGFVEPSVAFVIGIFSAVLCYWMVAYSKPRLGYDDTLDAFGVHGVGGILGSLAVGLFATPLIQANYAGAFYGNIHLFVVQLLAVVVTAVFSGVVTYILFKLVDKFVGLRVSKKDEAMGLDETQHSETAYTAID
jgi:Amt family ammonium transporter